MKNLFLDTNILIDFLADRKPFSEPAAILFQLSADHKIKLFVAAVSISNVYYVVRQVQSHAKTIELLRLLQQYVEVVPVDGLILNKATNSGFKDFEDAIQSFAAESVPEIEAIITRNLKDFKKSNLPVFAPDVVINLLNA
jgi:predicted nucleic acid-binding protein